MSYEFDFFYIWKGLPILWQGLLVTLQLTLWATILGTIAGFGVALCALSKSKFLTVPTTVFIEFFRCTPALIQLIWFFYCVPLIFNVWWDPMTLGILALGLNLTAFNAEAYRAAIQSIPRAHLDAGIALGLTSFERIRHVIFPEAFRTALPVLMTNMIGIFQQSALVAIISIEDLMYQGRFIGSQTFRYIEVLSTVALIYFAISFPVSLFVTYFERRNERMMAR